MLQKISRIQTVLFSILYVSYFCFIFLAIGTSFRWLPLRVSAYIFLLVLICFLAFILGEWFFTRYYVRYVEIDDNLYTFIGSLKWQYKSSTLNSPFSIACLSLNQNGLTLKPINKLAQVQSFNLFPDIDEPWNNIKSVESCQSRFRKLPGIRITLKGNTGNSFIFWSAQDKQKERILRICEENGIAVDRHLPS